MNDKEVKEQLTNLENEHRAVSKMKSTFEERRRNTLHLDDTEQVKSMILIGSMGAALIAIQRKHDTLTKHLNKRNR